MKRQRVIRIFPTGKPPDPESESPGAVGTAIGAEVQSVLERTTQAYRKLDQISSRPRQMLSLRTSPVAAARVFAGDTIRNRL